MSSKDEEKTKLRKSIKHVLSTLSEERKRTWSALIIQKLEAHPAFKEARNVLLYYSMPDEPATHDFAVCCAKDKHVYLPVVVSNTEMEIRRFASPSELRAGAYGILEPTGPLLEVTESIDLIVVPGVAFDRQGHRMGHGKGYYDRFIARFHKRRPYLIGLCFPCQLLPSVPFALHDAVMDCVITAE